MTVCALRIGPVWIADRDALHAPETFGLTDVSFHRRIAAVARKPNIEGLEEAMLGRLIGQLLTAGREPAVREAARAQHRRIHEAIVAREPDAAETAMRLHLADVSANAWRARAA